MGSSSLEENKSSSGSMEKVLQTHATLCMNFYKSSNIERNHSNKNIPDGDKQYWFRLGSKPWPVIYTQNRIKYNKKSISLNLIFSFSKYVHVLYNIKPHQNMASLSIYIRSFRNADFVY